MTNSEDEKLKFAALLRDRLEMSPSDEQLAVLSEGYRLMAEMLKGLHDGFHPSVEPAPRFSVEGDR